MTARCSTIPSDPARIGSVVRWVGSCIPRTFKPRNRIQQWHTNILHPYPLRLPPGVPEMIRARPAAGKTSRCGRTRECRNAASHEIGEERTFCYAPDAALSQNHNLWWQRRSFLTFRVGIISLACESQRTDGPRMFSLTPTEDILFSGRRRTVPVTHWAQRVRTSYES